MRTGPSIPVTSLDDGRFALVELDLGRGNVLDLDALGALGEVLTELTGRGGPLRAVALRGRGGQFSYGASVRDHLPDRMEAMLAAMRAVALALTELPAVTIAAIEGHALGGGLELALACDRIVAAPGAVLGHPEIDLAVLAPIGSVLLPLRVGPARALELLVSGARVDATASRAAGLVDEVAPDPVVAARAFCESALRTKSAAALRSAVLAARSGRRRALREDLPPVEALYRDRLMHTADALEGLTAFLEKRPPRFRDA